MAAALLVCALAACAHSHPGPGAWGPHVDGLRDGFWQIAHEGGFAEEGRYVAGRLHGPWVLRDPRGAVIAREYWCSGRPADPGDAGCR